MPIFKTSAWSTFTMKIILIHVAISLTYMYMYIPGRPVTIGTL